ncbi:HNH endonuclease signature motif containing protein [Pantoea sp. B65]|uniref:HNH endonuclease signature motif containing protein n=1 Tax=Pantoea sp. B65 TaxID=2813359 RepID=UPI0039B3DB27
MRFNYDLLPGQLLSFEEIALRYAQRYPEEKELTARGLLSPSTVNRHLVIRAVFAHQESNGPLEDLLFVAGDNERKNYLRRFEHYLKQQQSFLYLRRGEAGGKDNRWKVMGESQVWAMLDPTSADTQNLLASRGYKLSLMRQEGEEEYWQLFNPQLHPCFNHSRRVQFIVVLTTPLLTPPAAVIAGTQVGRRVKVKVWQHAVQAEFTSAVKARYGACVITGTLLTPHMPYPWLEVCHIDTRENEEGFLIDNSVDNGLYLRSDLQRLFASRMISIDATRGTVRFRQAMQQDEILSQFWREIDGKVCALWDAVPAATRARLDLLR